MADLYRIAKTALGLLDLLRLKGTGKYPQELSSTLIPVIELSNFYGTDILFNTTGTPTVGPALNLTETVTTTVPVRVRGLGGRLTVGAAPFTAGGFIEWGIQINGVPVPFGAFLFGVAAATQVVGAGSDIPGIILPAQSILYVGVGGTAAGADHSLSLAAMIENYNPAVA